jgi:hypothetical protein
MWRAPTEDDFLSAISSAEDTTFRTRLTHPGQDDPYASILAQGTGLFRDAIRSHPANRLDAEANTLPEAAIFHMVVIMRQRLCGRFNVGEQTETRRDEFKEATKWLAAVAKGDIRVEEPGENPPTQTPTLSPAVNESPRRDGWRHQDGI